MQQVVKKEYLVNGVAGIMLALMLALMFLSIRDDTIVIDEDPHIGAGYSYLRKADHRLNPEHPPLMKDLGALPLLLLKLREPWDDKSWATDINGQWEFGRKLIFSSGNDADAIAQTARAPLIVFTALLGGVLFWWTKRRFGSRIALLTLFFYVFSPTFLAHGRLVTTDVGAAAGFFLGIVAFLRFLEHPTGSNLFLAGLATGFAFLTKFSTFQLVPLIIILAIIRALACTERGRRLAALRQHLAATAAIIGMAYLIVYPLYLHHTWKYPPERQKRDTQFILESFNVGFLRKTGDWMERRHILPQQAGMVREFPKNLVIWAADKPVLRPWAEYFLGLLMVFQRAAGGNTTYFLGDVSAAGSQAYFPLVYLLKEPAALHLLTVAALGLAILGIRRFPWHRSWLREHFAELAFLIVIAFYWTVSVRSNLNIGVRHVLPTFPFIYVLVAKQIGSIGKALPSRETLNRIGRLILGALLAWQAVSVLRAHPFYLAYFNEAAGGPDGGYRYVVDSNLDWGQDLKRLAKFAQDRSIEKIAVDYFGWADPVYYLGNRYQWLSSADPPRKGWVAVSATFYQGSRERPEHDYRRWLPLEKLVAKIGYSIFVFYLE